MATKISTLVICFLLWNALPSYSQNTTTDDGKISIQFLQLNDVYEIAPLENGAVGGMARVATLRQQLKAENPNTCTVLSGDFLFPSAMGTIAYEGKAIKGRQMVEAMNVAGVDLVTFGNHEFDLKEAELETRINESRFDWVSSNVLLKTPGGDMPFTKAGHYYEEQIPQTRVLTFRDADGTAIKVGIFGICINTPTTSYVTYEDYHAAAQRAINDLKGRSDFILAITHLSIAEDRKLAAAFPDIKLIFGGHEHTHSYDTVGTVLIAKADANARTVYVHQLAYDKTTRQLSIQSRLVKIDNTIREESVTKAVVDKWIGIADKSLRDQGFVPDEVLSSVSEAYDGRESEVRYRSTNLTALIAKAISATVPGSDCSMYNSGSIRLDDELAGTITQYDVVRTLPYGGTIMKAQMRGSLLKRALDSSLRHPGNGCFVQCDRIAKDQKGRWMINGKKIEDARVYTVVVNDFLVSGQQQYLEFLNDKNPEMVRIDSPAQEDLLRKDLRQAVIAYLRKGGK